MNKVIVTMASGREIVTTRVVGEDLGGGGRRVLGSGGMGKRQKMKSGKKSGDWIGLLASSITDTHSSC